MKTRILTSVVCGLAGLLLLSDFSWAASINQRQRWQQQRIWHGFRSGDLTPREFRRLERDQWRIWRSRNRARRDCRITSRERRRIQHLQNRAGRRIFYQRHDGQVWR